MEPTPSFDDLEERLHSGDDSAATEIVRRFAQRLAALASRRLVGALRQKVDAEDLVQSALKSFFRANAATPFELSDWHSLWSLLATITLRKFGYQARQFLTGKRNIRREEAADESANWGALARDPTPEEAALFAETVAQLLTDLEDKARQVVELSLQGLTPAEIGPRVGLTERSVYRQLERVRVRLLEACQE
jgi:RNA polymerase sigma factor (sigma-70 family)